MSRIFISYRREDTAGHTGRLNDWLKDQFRRDEIFMDIYSIEGGVDFADKIKKGVSSCDVLIAVIGKQWLSIRNASGNQRLSDPNDPVRLEIATALSHTIAVVPVLFQGASMPDPSELPEEVRHLTRLNAIEISDLRWDYDLKQLVSTLRGKLKKSGFLSLGRLSAYWLLIIIPILIFIIGLIWMTYQSKRNFTDEITSLSSGINYDRPVSEALEDIKQLTAYVKSLGGSSEGESLAISKVKPLLGDGDPGGRRIRRAVIEAMKEIRRGELQQDFQDGTGIEIDLIGADFSNANLREVSFKNAFLIETSFKGADLSKTDFSNAFIRNVKFTGAELTGAVLTEADWFNSLGLTRTQLQAVNPKDLRPCPSEKGAFTEMAFQLYLKGRYVFPFEQWGSQVQGELLLTWKDYGRKGGLCETVRLWHKEG